MQEYADDRPDMAEVVFMLSNENSPLPDPSTPGFCKRNDVHDKKRNIPTEADCSINEVTFTTNYTR